MTPTLKSKILEKAKTNAQCFGCHSILIYEMACKLEEMRGALQPYRTTGVCIRKNYEISAHKIPSDNPPKENETSFEQRFLANEALASLDAWEKELGER